MLTLGRTLFCLSTSYIKDPESTFSVNKSGDQNH